MQLLEPRERYRSVRVVHESPKIGRLHIPPWRRPDRVSRLSMGNVLRMSFLDVGHFRSVVVDRDKDMKPGLGFCFHPPIPQSMGESMKTGVTNSVAVVVVYL